MIGSARILFNTVTLLSLFILYSVGTFVSAQTTTQGRVQVRLVTDEAEAVLDLLAKRKANQSIT